MSEERETGTVKWFDPVRGYGFITRRGARDVFVGLGMVRRSGLETLNKGDRVSFTVGETPKGPQAENLAWAETEIVGSKARLSKKTNFRFGPDYLRDGYFETAEGALHPRLEILDTLAMDVARVLVDQNVNLSQLRRFFNKARGIQFKLDRTGDFEAVRADIYAFKRDVIYQVGRDVMPEEFRQFIDRNVELAVQNEGNFRKGFLQHFESVLAYFVYFSREE